MRVIESKSKNSTCYYIIKDYTKNGKRSTKIVSSIGNIDSITSSAKELGISIEQYLKQFLENYKNENLEKNEIVLIKKNSGKLIKKNQQYSYNVGFLFLKSIYQDLKLDKICEDIEKKYKFEFNLNDILSNLVYSRIIYPASKYKTHKLCKNFIESNEIQLVNMYRGLTYLNKELDFIQKEVFRNSALLEKRDTKIIYFDCTNFYFEIMCENGDQQFGINKQHMPRPQVSMGLFMDANGIPISFNIFPGNESETKNLLEPESKILDDFNLSSNKLVLCTDAGLCTDEIKKKHVTEGRGFVITQSLKKLKKIYKDEIFTDTDWRIQGDFKNLYNIKEIQDDEKLSEKYYDTIFYKIIQSETESVIQDIIVTFSIKYKNYAIKKRQGLIERAQRKIERAKGEKLELKINANDYRKYIKETSTTKKGEKATEYKYEINETLINKDAQYDGFYGLSTNLIDDVSTILKVAQGRWEIEESFRIMKTDFIARPVSLSRDDRITAHFLTCFLSLLVYRLLERKLDYKYTITQILDTLKSMNVLECKGDGYIPTYTRTDITDDLHIKFGFRTDYEVNSYKNIKKICKQLENQ